jgi:hypothetical protein
MAQFGVRWHEFNTKDQLVQREQFFDTTKAREAFIKRLRTHNNFKAVVAMSG